jgi:hypothetical protein
MSTRRLPIRPNLDQLRHQAKDLLHAIRRSEPEAIAELQQHHSENIDPASAKLADAQLVLARSYEAASWPRLVQACKLIDAIWRDDVDAVRALVTTHPHLMHEEAMIRKNSNWGPPMTYAANLGRDRIIRMLRELGAKDLLSACGRAVLQSKIDTARMLHEMLGKPKPPADSLGGPAYTLSASGTAFLLEAGADVYDENGNVLAAVDVVLCSDSRKPAAKHQILEMYVAHGLELPETPVMALHRGRLDLLEAHLRRDPSLLRRTFTHAEIYPPEFGCGPYVDTQGTPLDGTTLLHMCVDFDELEIARWLLDRGMDPDVNAAIDAEGLGGHTPLFGAVVSYPHFWVNFDRYGPGCPDDAAFARLLLDAGANPNARASLRRDIRGMEDLHVLHEHRDATPLSWGERFPYKLLVSRRAMELVEAAGGGR